MNLNITLSARIFNRILIKYIHYPSFVPDQHLSANEEFQSHTPPKKSLPLVNKTKLTYQEFKTALKYNQVNDAWEIYNHLVPSPRFIKNRPPLHPEEHSSLLHHLVLHNHPRIASYRALRVYNRMKQYGVPLDRRDYHALLLVFVRNRDIGRATRLFNEISKVDSKSVSLMLSLYGEMRDSVKIYEMWDLIKSIPGALDNPDVWAVAIDAFGKSGYFDTSLELFNQYKDYVNNLPKEWKPHNLDRKPFEAMIKAYGTRGFLDLAKGLFSELENGDDMLDLESFDAIIHACKSCHNFEGGIFYWNKLLAFIDSRRLHTWRVLPLQSTICTMMSFHAEKKNLDTVLALYQKYRTHMMESLELLEILTWTLLHVGRHADAIEVYDRLKSKYYTPSDILSSTVEYFRHKYTPFS